MEEKIVFKNIRTKTKKSLIVIIVLTTILYLGYLSIGTVDFKNYKEHTTYEEHYYECYNNKGKEVYEKYEDDPRMHEMLQATDGVIPENCEYYRFNNIIAYSIWGVFHYWTEVSIIVTLAYLLIVLITVYRMLLTKCKFSVTENNIYGKKGRKNFDISFSNIIKITKQGKGIIIKTESSRLKLSPLKKCNEIYNHIKPFVPQRTTTQQSTSTVDDIKLF